MAALISLVEKDIAAGLRERGLPVDSFDDLTREEQSLVREYVALVFAAAKRELLDMLAQAIRRRRGMPE